MADQGNPPPKKNTKYVQMERRITNLKEQYVRGEKNALELCRSLAYYTGLP